MEAVILSGGLGTRLRPLTHTRPKPLLPIANKPLVQHILDRLPAEVDRAVLASGYLVGHIRRWAAELDHRVEVIVVEEKEPLGTAGAIANVANELTGDFLCFNGDVVSNAPLASLIEKRRRARAIGTLALWEVDDPSPFGVVALDGERVLRFVEKPNRDDAPSRLINAGTYCFDHAILGHIEAGRASSLERDVFPRLIAAGLALVGLPFSGYWVDCGRPDVYLEAHRLLLTGRLEVAPTGRFEGAWKGWACVGRASHVEPGATLERSVLLDGSTIGRGAHLADTIIGEGAHVGAGAHLARCIVADGATVAPGVALDGAVVEAG